MSATPEARSAREWAVIATIVIVLSVTCVGLGRWQWHRYESRSAEISRITTNYSADPVALDQLVRPDSSLPVANIWRQARLHGHYLPDATVLLRNRPVGGQPGFHVLTPFLDEDSGITLVIDRGFVTGIHTAGPEAVPAPPEGAVTATVHLRQDESASTQGTIPGQVHAINTRQVFAAGVARSPKLADKLTAAPATGAYGALARQEPAGTGQPSALPAPDTDPGNHLSYAFQWWVFSGGLLVMLGVMVQRERASRRVSIDDIVVTSRSGERVRAGAGAEAEASRRAQRRRADQEAEDELIEAQLDLE